MKVLRVTVASMERFTGNRWIGLAVSGILIATASVEVLENVTEIRAHHGLLIFGIANLIKTLPDFFHGAAVFEEAERR
jgi:hypothetical protein